MVDKIGLLIIEKKNHTGKNGNRIARLPVPDADCLVIRSANNPGMLFVEECGTNVIKMAKQGENAFPLLVIPDLRYMRIRFNQCFKTVTVLSYYDNGIIILLS